MVHDHKVTIRIDGDLRARIAAFGEAVKAQSGVAVSEGEAIRVLVEKGLATVEKPKRRAR